jgi:formate C-acetyltransferase
MLDPWLVRGEGGTAVINALTRGYFDAGGMHVQYNIVDPAILLDAKEHPERHRDLVVRISGYSAYFNDLTPEMQNDIIARTLHTTAAAPACRDGGEWP